MKIISWNVAGLRSIIKKEEFNNFFKKYKFDILCFQEIKVNENEIILPDYIDNNYIYSYWNSSKKNKGLSGVLILSKIKPIKDLEYPNFDDEGRIYSLEFKKYILINVYVPNSQKINSERYNYREIWNKKFNNYLKDIKKEYPLKKIIICGDMNVAFEDIDINNPKLKRNKYAGFYDNEREAFDILLKRNRLKDVFRILNPNTQAFTYWSNFLKSERSNKNGWRLDYFLVSNSLIKYINNFKIYMEIKGSDHCPIMMDIEI